MEKMIAHQQSELDSVRTDISILLHHDAITGTSSPTAEFDWLNMIYKADTQLRRVQYELTEKLGRIQSMNQKVDVGFVGFRSSPVETPVSGRGAMQFSVFNPLLTRRCDLSSIKVYTNNITLTRID